MARSSARYLARFALFLLAVAAFAPGIFDGINHLPGIMGEVQRLSAVDVPLLAGDELAERRTEKDDGASDVLDIAHMPQDIAVQLLPLHRRDRIMAERFGLDRSRCDAIEAD